MSSVVGLLLAAGAGRRMGRPKALVTDAYGVPWVVTASRALAAGGCARVIVVIGAEADAVRAVLGGEPVTVVEARRWRSGMGASLRAGLDAVAGDDVGHGPAAVAGTADAVLVHLVDLPDVGPEVVRRLVAVAGPHALARAHYGDGAPPGHPVLIGRDHWAGVAATVDGDAGARAYLAGRTVVGVDCSDLAGGVDIDRPDGVARTVRPGACMPRRSRDRLPGPVAPTAEVRP